MNTETDAQMPINGDAVVNYLLGRVAELERQVALAQGTIAALPPNGGATEVKEG